ncbi:MAG TPA: hypothetical protein VFB12_32650 [Ktedonobacteraceae bacterium]|nr:hypothetical protein [Ktedonobacteraceae bacterium]
MRRRGVMYLFLVIALFLLVACGSGTNNGGAANGGTPNSNGNANPTRAASAAATQGSVASTPTVQARAFGTVVATTPVSGPSAVTAANAVRVAINDNSIVPSTKDFTKNVPYVFVITNNAHSPQDFIISQQTPQVQTSQATLVMVPATQLTPGSTREFTFSFPPQAAGMNLELTNHLAGPTGQGIQVPIQVK